MLLITTASSKLNRMIHKMGHVLTLVASLAMWFGIYSTIHGTIADKPSAIYAVVATTQINASSIHPNALHIEAIIENQHFDDMLAESDS